MAQWGAAEALAGPQDEVAKMAGEFDRRRRAIVAGLNRIPGLRCGMPQGAFYVFPDISGLFGRRYRGQPLRTSADVTSFLLEEARVAVVPGADFGSDRHLRLSYASSLAAIEEGLERIAAACAKLDA
jgi:aspartate aminotransferase